MNPPDHTKYLITVIGFLSFAALALGAFLIRAGFEGGGVLIGAGGNGLVGLVGFLGGRATRPNSINVEPPSNVTVNQAEEPKPSQN